MAKAKAKTTDTECKKTWRYPKGAGRMAPGEYEVVSIDVPPSDASLYAPITAGDVRAGDVIEMPRGVVRMGDLADSRSRVVEVDVSPVRIEILAVGRDSWSAIGGTRWAYTSKWKDLTTGKVTTIRNPHIHDPRCLVAHLGRFVKRGPKPACGGCCSCGGG